MAFYLCYLWLLPIYILCLKGVTIALGAVDTGMNEKEFIPLESHNTVETSRQRVGAGQTVSFLHFPSQHHSAQRPGCHVFKTQPRGNRPCQAAASGHLDRSVSWDEGTALVGHSGPATERPATLLAEKRPQLGNQTRRGARRRPAPRVHPPSRDAAARERRCCRAGELRNWTDAHILTRRYAQEARRVLFGGECFVCISVLLLLS